LKVSGKEFVIGVVLAVVMAFILPPVGLMLLFLALFGSLIVDLLVMFSGPKNITNSIIAWLAAKSAERIADKLSPKGNPHNPHAKASFINPLSFSPERFEQVCADLVRWMKYRDVRGVGGSSDMSLDIICFNEDGGRVGIQCKRCSPSRRVTAKEVGEFIRALSLYGCDLGI